MSDAEPEDRVKARLLAVAASCLAHARLVWFGTGSAAYSHTDGERLLDIKIEITSTTASKTES